MSRLTTSRPSRMPVIVASRSEVTARLSGEFVCSDPATGRLCSDLRRVANHTIAMTNNSAARTSTNITIRRRLTRATNKTIAYADHRLDAVATLIELLPQATDVHVKRSRIAIVTVSPNTIQQLLPRDYSIGAARQHREKREFFVREFYLRTVAGDANVVEVDQEMIVLVSLAHRFVRAAHHGTHARQKLAHRERFGDVVVGAEVEPGDAIRFRSLGREHDDRSAPRGRFATQPATQFDAAHSR